MLPAHKETLSFQLVTNNKYARQVHSCAAGFKAIYEYCVDKRVKLKVHYSIEDNLTPIKAV